MAKKKKDDSGSILLLIMLVLLVIIALITPILLMIGYFYNKIKFNSIRKGLSGTMSDFWLNEDEKTLFKNKFSIYLDAYNSIENATSYAIQKNIAKNKDGSVSIRSNDGKKIRTVLEENQPIKEQLSSELYALQTLPYKRWQKFNSYAKNSTAFALSLFVWIGTLMYYYITLGKESIEELINPYLSIINNIIGGQSNNISLGDTDVKIIAIASSIAIITFFSSKYIFKETAKSISPIPEEVTIENIDFY